MHDPDNTAANARCRSQRVEILSSDRGVFVRALHCGGHTVRMNELLVRRAEPSEYARLAGMRWNWIVEEAGGVPLGDQGVFETEFEAWAHANAETHHAYVAIRHGALVGMAWLALIRRVPSPRALRRSTGDVQSVYVVPEHRAAGIGAALIAAVKEAAEEAGAERVTVHSSSRARTAYMRAGFSVEPRLMLVELP